MGDSQFPPLIDGHPLPDGFGIEISPAEFSIPIPIAGIYGILKPQPMGFIAWVTAKNRGGEYERVHEVAPGSVVEMRILDQSIWYKDGVVYITKVEPTLDPALRIALELAGAMT